MSISCEYGVIEFPAQIMPVLSADSGLEAVVVAVGGVLLLVDAGIALVVTQLIRDWNVLTVRIGSRVIARIARVCA